MDSAAGGILVEVASSGVHGGSDARTRVDQTGNESGVNPRAEALRVTVWAATLCSFAMIANQIAGKAVRDAMFLSQFNVDLLPRMVVVSAVVSLVFVLLISRILRRYGPALLVRGSFGVSSLLLLLIWGALRSFPGAAAVALYLHVAVLGAILVSWFWLLLSECFDARAARAHVARIAAGGTLGGLVGGLTAERVGAISAPGRGATSPG